MKVWLISAACAITLGVIAFGPARATSCGGALQVFRAADADFSAADKGLDKAAWQAGNSIIAAHHNDVPPAGCDQDEFDFTRLVAMEHGLRTGVAVGMVDRIEAVMAATKLRATTLQNAQLRRQNPEAQVDLQKHFGGLIAQSDRYIAEMMQGSSSSVLTVEPQSSKCAKPYADAVASSVVAPRFPGQAQSLGGTFVILVRVTILANGDLKDAGIFQSSGNPYLDRAALDAARASRYSPKIINCQPVTGTYIFRTTFSN